MKAIDLLLLILPLLTAIGCMIVTVDKKRTSYTRLFFLLMFVTFFWLFFGEFVSQYMGQHLLIGRIVRALPFRLTAFVAVWAFAFASKMRDKNDA